MVYQYKIQFILSLDRYGGLGMIPEADNAIDMYMYIYFYVCILSKLLYYFLKLPLQTFYASTKMCKGYHFQICCNFKNCHCNFYVPIQVIITEGSLTMVTIHYSDDPLINNLQITNLSIF